MLKDEPDEAKGICAESSMSANGAVFFLIREQAKSVVAIKELETRLAVLEDLQERLMQAVQYVQHHLIFERTDRHIQRSCMHSDDGLASSANGPTHVSSTLHECELKRDLLHSTPISKNDTKGDSINKDSGVLSDYKERSDGSTCTACSNCEQPDFHSNEDELLHLLDIIDEKSSLLLQQVENVGINSPDSTAIVSNIGNRVTESATNSYTESVIIQRQLCEVKADRDDLKDRLTNLELAADAVTLEKKNLQKKLEDVVSENRHLLKKIQNAGDISELNSYFVGSDLTVSSVAEFEKAAVRKRYLQYSEKSRQKVVWVLKESNILELQKQLLTYIMENDVLQAKLEQLKPSKASSWSKLEARFQKDLKRTKEENKRLEKVLLEKNAEILSMQTRIRGLEDSLDQVSPVRNFGLNSNDDWRQRSENGKEQNLVGSSPLDFGDFSKTQSLPVTWKPDKKNDDVSVDVKRKLTSYATRSELVGVSLNTSSFCPNKQLNCYQGQVKNENLLDLNNSGETDASGASTPSQSGYWTQAAVSSEWYKPQFYSYRENRNNNGKSCEDSLTTLQFGGKPTNEHFCWKNRDVPASDLDSICTEFDPLSGVPSCENFVDSLNLSIPLKPTQLVPRLSSVGDSLHSNSLDLGCRSLSAWQCNIPKLSSACSVDGLRQVLTERNSSSVYKTRTLPPNGIRNNPSITSVMSNKFNEPKTLNISECAESLPRKTLK